MLLVQCADFCVAMEKERLEAIEGERAIAEFSRKKESLMEHRQSLLKQIEETRQSLQKKRERMSWQTREWIAYNLERSLERRALAAQASKNGPELSFWEEHLAMKLEGVKEDVLRIVYSHVYESDWTRECCFTIDLSERDYKGKISALFKLTVSVIECKPVLNNLKGLVDQLNESREFFEFLKCMRQAFKQQSMK